MILRRGVEKIVERLCDDEDDEDDDVAGGTACPVLDDYATTLARALIRGEPNQLFRIAIGIGRDRNFSRVRETAETENCFSAIQRRNYRGPTPSPITAVP